MTTDRAKRNRIRVMVRHCMYSAGSVLLFTLTVSMLSIPMLSIPGLAAATEHHYRVVIAADLTSVEVEGRLAEPELRVNSSRGRLQDLINLKSCSGAAVRPSGDGFRAVGGCFRYVAPLRGTASRSYGRQVPKFAGHEWWLWLPALNPGDVVKLALELPADADVALPWHEAGREGANRLYELRRSPGSGDAVAWFGVLQRHPLKVGNTDLPLILVGDGLNHRVIKPWLEEAAGLVASVGGGFPNVRAQVLVEPGESGLFDESPVPFGHVIRSGEEMVRFFVAPQATHAALRRDWTAVHEFSHLLLPYVRDDQKWISEGFASYYQNVLLARGGIYTPGEAWGRLLRSFQSAGSASRPPSPNDAYTRSFWDVRMLIYWSGAAIALMADVELRRTSGGQESLDTVLGKLSRCCLPSTEVWEGRELFMKLDELAGRDVFVPLYDKHANTPGMPPVNALLVQMGVYADRKGVSLDASAALAGIAEAIMRRGMGIDEWKTKQGNLE